jgi:hypothetical protein
MERFQGMISLQRKNPYGRRKECNGDKAFLYTKNIIYITSKRQSPLSDMASSRFESKNFRTTGLELDEPNSNENWEARLGSKLVEFKLDSTRLASRWGVCPNSA